jgi:adenosylcobinamide-GDP ribazoletransferase
VVNELRSAVGFLTRIPMGDTGAADPNVTRNWFPIVGLAIGAVVGGTFAGASWLMGGTVGAVVAVAVGAMVTGAFHHDGLADVADAFGGGWNPEQRLAILKDSRHGTYGVMALVLATAAQVAGLAALGPLRGFLALVCAHGLGRAGAVALMLFMRPARVDGLAVEYHPTHHRGGALATCVVTVIAAALCFRQASIIVVPIAAAGTAAVGWLSHRKIGGIVGDALGATEQIVETLILLTAAALTRHLTTWW